MTATLAVANYVHLRKVRIITKRRELNLNDLIIEVGDDLFKRLYRFVVLQFKQFFGLLKPNLERRHNRTGSGATNDVENRLLITLRMLAGASYLDVQWTYKVASSTIYKIFYEKLEYLNKVLPAIGFPVTKT